nr:MAG TPA: hypothetical protein [Caudoviricetes sp.]
MKEIWKYFVRYAVEDSFAVKEGKRREGTSDAELAYTDGAYNAAYTCAVASRYKGSYLHEVVDAVDDIMKDYIENGGDPYGVSDYMDKVFERLYKRGLSVEVGWDFLK